MLLYLGPDTAMPLASALAVISGVLILFWNKTVAGVRRVLGAVGRLNMTFMRQTTSPNKPGSRPWLPLP